MTQRRIYQDEFPYFVTFRTLDSQPLFEDEKMAELFRRELFVSAKIKHFDIFAYQIMPDHIHVLTQINVERTLESMRSGDSGDGDGEDIVSMRSGVGKNILSSKPERTFSNVREGEIHPISAKSTLSRVRTKTPKYNISDLMQSIKGNFSRKIHEGNIWQKRFYTKIVNTHKYLETVINYIENNPIKAELPKRYQQKPYQYFNWPKIHALF
ncbi:MAG: transposase [Patescibacteria group bacterium]|jgi:REP element-mobilizing transposase RayT